MDMTPQTLLTQPRILSIAALLFAFGCGTADREHDEAARVSGGPDVAESQVPPGEGDSQSAPPSELDGCNPRELGDFEATVSGSHSRSIERGDEGAWSGMTPDPQGGPEWILQIRNRTTSDLDFAVLLPEFPAAGAEYDLVDGDLFTDQTVMGGIAFMEDDQSAFHLGNVNVRVTGVSDDAACGTIFADLVGLQAGKTAAREAPDTIKARFWAEVRR